MNSPSLTWICRCCCDVVYCWAEQKVSERDKKDISMSPLLPRKYDDAGMDIRHGPCRRNGYSRRFICKKRADIPASPEPVGTVCLPYVKGLSEAIRRVLTPLNIRVGFKPPPSLRDILTNVKDPVPVISRSDVVYRIPCGECSNSYIGQTMGCRIKEHQHATFEGNKNASALVHCENKL